MKKPLNVVEKILSAHLVEGDPATDAEIGIRIDQTLTQDAMCILAKEIDPKMKIERIFPAKMVDLVYEEYNQKVQIPNA